MLYPVKEPCYVLADRWAVDNCDSHFFISIPIKTASYMRNEKGIERGHLLQLITQGWNYYRKRSVIKAVKHRKNMSIETIRLTKLIPTG